MNPYEMVLPGLESIHDFVVSPDDDLETYIQDYLDTDPEFQEALDQAHADVDAGNGISVEFSIHLADSTTVDVTAGADSVRHLLAGLSSVGTEEFLKELAESLGSTYGE